jgi:hypothetical protein
MLEHRNKVGEALVESLNIRIAWFVETGMNAV